MALEVAQAFWVHTAENEIRTHPLLVRCVRNSKGGGGGVRREGQVLSDICFHTQNSSLQLDISLPPSGCFHVPECYAD